MSKKQPKLLFSNDPWLLGEEIPDCDVFFFQIPLSAFLSDSSFPFIKNYNRALVHYKKFHMDFYMPDANSNEVAKSVLNALLTGPTFGKELNGKITEWSHKLIDFSNKLPALPIKTYTNKQLWELYEEHDVLHTKLYTYGWLPVAVDLFHNNFTAHLKSYLYGICKTKQDAENAFVVLTTPSKKTLVAEEREAFLYLYTKYKKELRKAGEQFKNELSLHARSWGHLGYIYAGNVKPFGPEHYIKEMQELEASKITAEKILKKEAQQLQTAKKKQIALYKKLKISKQYKELFETAQDFALTKLLRRHAQLLALQNLHKGLLEEISKRLKQPRKYIQFMLMEEVKQALLNGKVPSKAKMADRFKESIFYTEKNSEVIYTGPKMKKIKKGLGRVYDKNQKELTGQTAQPGYAKGIVKIIIRAKDMPKMNKGDILVSIATDPDVVPAMKKAAAIVTEQGGITSHAAIVSRELGIPCIIGTKIATKIFKDGDLVEVDANKGIVKKL